MTSKTLIDALRIMVMQHQVALDIVLAEKGGLCVLFNTTCCTYIPDNIHSSNMTDALKVLKQLQNVQSKGICRRRYRLVEMVAKWLMDCFAV